LHVTQPCFATITKRLIFKQKLRIIQEIQGGFTMGKLFTAVIQKENTWYVAKCLENSVASQGETMDEAITNLREALELYYEDEVAPTPAQTFVTTLEVAI